MADRLYRSRTDRPIAGVAGGLGAWLGIDPSLVRVAWVVLGLLSGGIFVLVYIVMIFVVPLAPDGWQPRPYDRYYGPQGPGAAGPGPGPGPGPDGSVPPPPASWPDGWNQQRGAPPVDTGRAGIVAGIVLIAIGAWFLVDDYIHIDWQVAWPVVVILLGAGLILGAARRR